MRHHRLAFALAVSLFAAPFMVVTTPASAQNVSQGISITDAIRIAKENGVVRVEETKFDDGKWEVEGRDQNGREIEIDIDGRTGKVIKIERD